MTSNHIKIGMGVLFSIGLFFLARYLLSTDNVTVELTAHNWRREIQIEDFNPRQDADWCPAPGDAYDVSRQRKQRGGHFVTVNKVHTYVPDYDDWCSYTVDRWRFKRREVASGTDTHNVYWPEFTLENPGDCYGCEREGKRLQKYSVNLKDTDGDSVWSCDFSQPLWSDMPQGMYAGQVRRLGNTLLCDTLRRR